MTKVQWLVIIGGIAVATGVWALWPRTPVIWVAPLIGCPLPANIGPLPLSQRYPPAQVGAVGLVALLTGATIYILRHRRAA